MKQCHCLLFLLFISALALMALPVQGYEILLDLDTDNDPATINELTNETSALVKVVLWPTTSGEAIGLVEFYLGSTCYECPPDGGVQVYGTEFDWFDEEGWVTAPGFDSSAMYPTCLGCCFIGGFGARVLLSFEPKSGTFTLDEPMFICEFNAWVNPDEPPIPGCPVPPSDLVSIGDGDYWNRVLLDAEGNATEAGTWGGVKSIYR